MVLDVIILAIIIMNALFKWQWDTSCPYKMQIYSKVMRKTKGQETGHCLPMGLEPERVLTKGQHGF